MCRIAFHNKCLLITGLVAVLLGSCETFFDPQQEIVLDYGEAFSDWNEYRAAELGLYKLQQDLVDQIVILGELRADLLEITPNADPDLLEVYNFDISPQNKYASPIGFYRLIGACNSLANQLETFHPEILEPGSEITPYTRLYGEVICMRAWAYFYAVRIFEKVPYIWPDLTSAESISQYVNTGITVIDTMRIEYGIDGYNNDTIYMDTIQQERAFLDMHAVIDTFTTQINERVRAVGVLHNLINEDPSWEVTIWTKPSMHCLLGQMYLHDGNLWAAREEFDQILFYNDFNATEGWFIRYGLDSKFESRYDSRFGQEGEFLSSSWKNIFLGLDKYEHILTVWFNKSFQQQNSLQYLFSIVDPNRYMLKPTPKAVFLWETSWKKAKVNLEDDPEDTFMDEVGMPGDFGRGYGVSYAYLKGENVMDWESVQEMLLLKKEGNNRAVKELMQGVDTVVYKYTLTRNEFDRDAAFPIYRAAGIHLYYAELTARGVFYQGPGDYRAESNTCLTILNNGAYEGSDKKQMGIRGRVGLGTGYDGIRLGNYIYLNDPYTNEITGYLDYTNNFPAKQAYLEEQMLLEKAREMAFEGERFFDLVRIAKRRGDPSFLADRVASKFTGAKAEQIRTHLMDEQNWYIHPWQ